MNKKYTEIEIWTMLQEAADKLTQTGQKSRPGISALCRQAGISRAHLYSSFPSLLEKLREPHVIKLNRNFADRLRELEQQNDELKRVNALLARTCLELKLAVLKMDQQSKFRN